MVRPRKCCKVDAVPGVNYFKPRGIPLQNLGEVSLSFEGFEAIRLADFEGLKQEEAAVKMGISRQTFGRLVSEARRIVAEAVTTGKALCVEGGNYEITTQESSQITDPDINKNPKGDVIMNKLAVSTIGPDLDSQIDERFGRAAGFIVIDPETMNFEYIDNGATQVMSQGAGISAAESIAKSGAKIVLTGYVGPKAFRALSAAGIEMGQDLQNMSVREAVQLYIDGKVDLASQPNTTGHR